MKNRRLTLDGYRVNDYRYPELLPVLVEKFIEKKKKKNDVPYIGVSKT